MLAKWAATLEPSLLAWLRRDVSVKWTEALQEMEHGSRYEGWDNGGPQKSNR